MRPPLCIIEAASDMSDAPRASGTTREHSTARRQRHAQAVLPIARAVLRAGGAAYSTGSVVYRQHYPWEGDGRKNKARKKIRTFWLKG
ncbi:hypothetical protein BHM03_00055593 [Ensete ventricosum]|nr:hypothetical protein BHM03_00055593 [Ensete ventricosum]